MGGIWARRLVKDRLTLMVVWRVLLLVKSLVVVVDIYGWRDCGQTLGLALAERDVYDTCLAYWSAL